MLGGRVARSAMGTNTVARVLNDVGLAAWFGGSLMGAVGLDGAAASLRDPRQQASVADAGWRRWAPFGTAAMAAHLVGGTLLVPINKGRLVTQRGVFPTSAVQTVCSLGAVAATVAATATGRELSRAAGATPPGAGDGTGPPDGTGVRDGHGALDAGDDAGRDQDRDQDRDHDPDGEGRRTVPGPDVAGLTRRMEVLRLAVPLLTGASLVLNSRLGELQRPVPAAGGIARRLLPWR